MCVLYRGVGINDITSLTCPTLVGIHPYAGLKCYIMRNRIGVCKLLPYSFSFRVCNKDMILTQPRCAQLDPKHLKTFHSREFSVVVILKSALITSPII
ncbi:hypothetical protein MKX03_020246 [Papaver bracteatum]|nr:hypothetical protein MKX03_020246 [Papaver bracteatum]